MDLLLSKRVDATFNDSLSYLDYKKQNLMLRSKLLNNAEQNKSAFRIF